uniref:serine/threonine-protein kinase Chk2-like n=1 Tax=Styela clava TaxID=7725 RepID=UPI00193A5CE6|nr:serine/threonine-protein kinase Chk2-like [Styela clava]
MNENQNSNVGQNGKEEKPQSSGVSGTQGNQQSSSSSGQTGTSSSSGTANTVSSAETVPTQEPASVSDEGADVDEPPWGVLYPIDRCFYPFDLREDIYTFGRGQDCTYTFDIPSIKQTQHFTTYSKKHFTITRTKSNTGTYTVMLDDSSMNGVFINGEKIPKRGSRPLCDKDEISISSDKNRVLLFFDKSKEEDPNLPQKFKEKYIMQKVIGNGAFGEVREAMQKFGGYGRHAVKIINKQKTVFHGRDPGKINEDVLKEARLLLALRHPCIIRVDDVIDSPQNLYIVLELACGGELFTRIIERGKGFDEPVAKLLFFQMLSAVSYLHDNNVTHRDLKPENILMMSDDEECLIQITDFGVSRLVGEASMMKTQAGTPSYLAPELVKSFRSSTNEGYTRQVDSWSLGVILYVCLVAYPPFSRDRQDTKQGLLQQITTAYYNFDNDRWKSVSDNAISMIKGLLTIDAKKRLTPKQGLDHVWLKDDVMRKKAHALMSSTIINSPSANHSLINKIQKDNELIGTDGISIAVQEKEVSSSSTKSACISEERRTGKRHLPSDTSGESNSSNGDGDALHLKEKHFAGTSAAEPDTPKLHNPPHFDKK